MSITSISEALNSHLIQGETGSPTTIKSLNVSNPVSDEYDRTPGDTPIEHFIGTQSANAYQYIADSPDDRQDSPNLNNDQPLANLASEQRHTPTSDDEYVLWETNNAETIITNLNQALEELRIIFQTIEQDRQNDLADPRQINRLEHAKQNIERLLTDPDLQGQEVDVLLTQAALEQIAVGNGTIDTHNPTQSTGINPTPVMIGSRIGFIIPAKFAGQNGKTKLHQGVSDSVSKSVQARYSRNLNCVLLSMCDNYGRQVYPKDIALYPQEIQSFILRKKHTAES